MIKHDGPNWIVEWMWYSVGGSCGNVSHPDDERCSFPSPLCSHWVSENKIDKLHIQLCEYKSDVEMKRVQLLCNWNDTIQAGMKSYCTVAHSWNTIVMHTHRQIERKRGTHACRIIISSSSHVVSLFADAILRPSSTHLLAGNIRSKLIEFIQFYPKVSA